MHVQHHDHWRRLWKIEAKLTTNVNAHTIPVRSSTSDAIPKTTDGMPSMRRANPGNRRFEYSRAVDQFLAHGAEKLAGALGRRATDTGSPRDVSRG
ncbi:MAG: hypothetical protein WAL02_00500 [Rhodoplanes sp.]|jgi:hypothetical protein